MKAHRTLFVLAALLCAQPAAADAVADFYRGKTVTCFIGYGVGGGYDLFARTISRHLSRHIPGNPAIVPVNMPGASSMVLGNHLARRAPRDGTAFGAVNSALLFEPLFYGSESKAQFSGPDMTMLANAVTGDTFDGKRAVEIGLANFAVPKAKLRDETVKLAQKLMNLNPNVVRYTKEAIRAVRAMTDKQARDYLKSKQDSLTRNDKEIREQHGMKQFLDEKSYRPGLGPFRRESA